MNFNKRKLFKIVGTAVAVLLVVYIGLSAYGAKEAMVIPRLPLIHQGSELGVPYEDVSFTARGDNLTLKGWFLPGTNHSAIIEVHGGFQNRIDDTVDTLGLAPALVARGYSMLLFDFRGRGESEGQGISLSYTDEDIGGAVDYLKGRGFRPENIYLIGFCSGAAQVAFYGSRNNHVGGLVLDGCFIDDTTMVVRQAEYIDLPGFLAHFFMPGGMFFTRVMYGFHRIDPIDIIPAIKCPVLFIHEEFDFFTTTAETQRMLTASQNPANEMWDAGDALHSQGFRVHGGEYIDKVDNFLKKIYRP